MFMAMDTDNSGAITFDELKAGLRRYGSTLKDTEIRDLMDAVRCLCQSGYLHIWLFLYIFVLLYSIVFPSHISFTPFSYSYFFLILCICFSYLLC